MAAVVMAMAAAKGVGSVELAAGRVEEARSPPQVWVAMAVGGWADSAMVAVSMGGASEESMVAVAAAAVLKVGPLAGSMEAWMVALAAAVEKGPQTTQARQMASGSTSLLR